MPNLDISPGFQGFWWIHHCGTLQDRPAIIMRRQSPCALPCSGHTALHAFEGVGLSAMQPDFIYSLSQESAEEPLICFRLRCESCNCVVVLAATHRVLCGKEVAAHALVLQFPGIMLWQTELLRPKQSQNWSQGQNLRSQLLVKLVKHFTNCCEWRFCLVIWYHAQQDARPYYKSQNWFDLIKLTIIGWLVWIWIYNYVVLKRIVIIFMLM
jgi:hypothetical protein